MKSIRKMETKKRLRLWRDSVNKSMKRQNLKNGEWNKGTKEIAVERTKATRNPIYIL